MPRNNIPLASRDLSAEKKSIPCCLDTLVPSLSSPRPCAAVQVVKLLSSPAPSQPDASPTKSVDKDLHRPASTISTASASSWDSFAFACESTSSSPRPEQQLAALDKYPLKRSQRGFSFECSKYGMDRAAQGGHLATLKLLHEQVPTVRCARSPFILTY